MSKKLPVFLALDMDDKSKALSWARKASPYLDGLKVGPRLGFQLSQEEWLELSVLGKVFLDYKFFDIPSTVESAVRRAFDTGATFCTVHLMNGAQALQRLAALEKELNKLRPFRVVGVSVLTSFGEDNVMPLVASEDYSKMVLNLVAIGYEAGIRNFVSSPFEAKELKSKFSDISLITPGVRFKDQATQDQKRVMDPKTALTAGADYLVMGRALLVDDFEKRIEAF